VGGAARGADSDLPLGDRQAGGAGAGGAQASADGGKPGDEEVVDAEFEVKE
jgi:hypothetical protein